MKELVSLLGIRERKTVSTLATVFGLVAAALLIFGLRAQVRAGRASRFLAAAEGRALEAERSRDAAGRDLERWRQASQDVRQLASGWFYDPAKGVPGLRLDLENLFVSSGIVVPEIAYNEIDLVKGKLRRVTAEFKVLGSYLLLRKLLETVENHPRALHVDKIEFEDLDSIPGQIQVRIALAGYYLYAK